MDIEQLRELASQLEDAKLNEAIGKLGEGGQGSWTTLCAALSSILQRQLVGYGQLRDELEMGQIEKGDMKQRYETKLEELNRRLKQAEEEKRTMQERVSGLEKQIPDAAGESAANVMYLTEKYRSELQLARSELIEEQKRGSSLRMELLAVRTERELEESKRKMAELQLAERTRENKELRADVGTAEQQLGALQREFLEFRGQKTGEVFGLQSRLSEVQSSHEHEKGMCERLRGQVARLEDKVSVGEEQITRLEMELAEQTEVFKREIESKDKLVTVLKRNLEETLVRIRPETHDEEVRESVVDGGNYSGKEVAALKEQLERERAETEKLKGFFEEVCMEVEEKVSLFRVERGRNEKLETSIKVLETRLSDAEAKKAVVAKELDSCRKEKIAVERERNDLAQQVRSLLCEIEEQSPMVPTDNGDNSIVRDADQVISDRLVVFRSVNELQERNLELLRTIRRLTAEREEESEAQGQLEEALKQLGELRAGRSAERAMVESLVAERNDLQRLVQGLQSKQQSHSNDSIVRSIESLAAIPLKDEVERHKQSLENNHLRRQLEHSESRLSELKEQMQYMRDESDGLKKKYYEMSVKLVEQQGLMGQNLSGLVEARTQVAQLQARLAEMQSERKLVATAREGLEAENGQQKQEIARLSAVVNQLTLANSELHSSHAQSVEKLLLELKSSIPPIAAVPTVPMATSTSSTASATQPTATATGPASPASNESASEDRTAVTAPETESEAINEEIRRLLQELSDAHDTINRLNESVAEKTELLLFERAERDKADASLSNAEQAASDAESQMSAVQSDMERYKELCASLQTRLDDVMALHAKDLERLSSLKADSAQNEERETKLKKEVDSYKELLQLRADEAKMDSERIAELKKRVSVLEEQCRTLVDVRADEAGLESRLLAILRGEKDALLSENGSLQAELKRVRMESERLNTTVGQLEQRLSEMSKTDTMNGSEYSSLLERVEQMNILRESNAMLRRESEERLQRITMMEEQVNRLRAELSSVEDGRVGLVAEKDTLMQSNRALEERVKALTSGLVSLKEAFKAQRAGEREELVKQRDEMMAERDVLKEEKERWAEEKKNLAQETVLLQQQMQALQQQMETEAQSLREKNQRLAKAVQTLKARVEALTTAAEQEKQEKQQNIEAIAALEREKAELTESLEASKGQLSGQQQLQDQLQEQQQLQAKLAASEEKVQKLAKACQLLKSRLQKESEQTEQSGVEAMQQELSLLREQLQQSQQELLAVRESRSDKSSCQTVQTDAVDQSDLARENAALSDKIAKYVAAIEKFQQLKASFVDLRAQLRAKDELLADKEALIQQLQSREPLPVPLQQEKQSTTPQSPEKPSTTLQLPLPPHHDKQSQEKELHNKQLQLQQQKELLIQKQKQLQQAKQQQQEKQLQQMQQQQQQQKQKQHQEKRDREQEEGEHPQEEPKKMKNTGHLVSRKLGIALRGQQSQRARGKNKPS